MSLTRFLGKSPEQIAHMTPEEQLEVFGGKIKERNIDDTPKEKLEIRNAVVVGSLIGALAYFTLNQIRQGSHHV